MTRGSARSRLARTGAHAMQVGRHIMPNHTQGNGRNVALPDENRPSWRPQDEQNRNRRPLSEEDDRFEDERYMYGQDRYARHWDERDRRDWDRDRDRDDGYRSSERYGQGQGGLARHPGYPGSFEERYRERGEDRFGGRGSSQERGYSPDRGYNPERYGAQGGYGGGRGWEAERLGMPRGYGFGDGDRRQYGTGGEIVGGTVSGVHPAYPAGGHRGKGPSGYQRTDERIREVVCEALTDDDRVDATHVEVTVKNGEVTLSGSVEDRYQKRMAEDCVENVAGVKEVQNHIRVVGEHGRR